jgi:hypothetical protein
MKLKMLSLAAFTCLLLSCGSTTSTTSNSSTSANDAYMVPATVQTTFTTQYPTASNVNWSGYDVTVVPVDWELSGWTALDANDHAVTFDLDGNRYYAWYDSDGNWIGSTYAVNDHTTLPAAVNSLITSRYSGYTIDKVQREMWKDHLAYEIKLKNGDNKIKVLVDENGNLLKEKNK